MGLYTRVALGEHAGKKGIIRFYGTTEFAAGRWVGIELDEPRTYHCLCVCFCVVRCCCGIHLPGSVAGGETNGPPARLEPKGGTEHIVSLPERLCSTIALVQIPIFVCGWSVLPLCVCCRP